MVWVKGELEEFVNEHVASGLYANNSELVRDALRRLRDELVGEE